MSTDDRTRAPLIADERPMLDGWLDHHRDTLALKCAGLTPEQLATRAVPPSSLSLLGLVRHMTDVERGWFDRLLAGADAPPLYYSDADPDGDFDNVDPATADAATVDAAFAGWRAQCARSREIVAALPSLDEQRTHRSGTVFSARWVMVHLIEEYARHRVHPPRALRRLRALTVPRGHADLLRERLDGSTGE